MQKTKKKYALRKTAAYGLVSCAVGLMLVGSVPTHARELTYEDESEMVNDAGGVGTLPEFTIFNWTGTFKSDKGEQLHDDAHLSADYERVIHEANNTADPWELYYLASDNMEDLNLEEHRFFSYGEPNTYTVGGNVFTVPGRIGDYYLASYDGNNMQHIGQNLRYTLQDNIYNEIGKQGVEVNRESNFVYRQKDTKITLRLIDAENPEKVYRTIEVPAFTNYEHNDLDTHVFDSFKSEGELLDNLPNEVALENDGKTIDVRLKKETYQNKVKIVNDAGEILAEKDLSAKYKDTVNYDMTDAFKALEDEYITSDDLSGNWTATTENQDIIIHAKERFTKDTETKQVKRIVRFHDGQNVVGEEDQVVTFTRTVKKEVVTGELTYSDWTSDHPQFDEITVPTKEDKTANVQSVPEKAVTAEDKDEIVDVYYSPKMVDGDTQTKASIHVVYKNADGTIYKEFDVQADKGSILDGSDLEMLPDDMNFTDNFTTYEVKGDGTDNIERTVKKQTSDNGTQTDNPTTSDGGTQTDNPDTSDSETQTKASIHVIYRNADGTIYKEFDVQADKGSILDGSDLEMLPDDMNFTDEFTTYEVKGDGTDTIERSVKKQTSDSGSQTDNPDTSDGSTQTKAEIKVVYKNADGTVYKEFVVNADKGAILDASDLEMLPDDMEFNDDFMFYEVKGDGADNIERIVKKVTSDQGSQTDIPDTSEGSTQTDNPATSDGSTHTNTPDSKDNGTQTDNPDTSDGSTQTKAEIKVVYKNADGTVYKEFAVNADKGTILDASDLEMLPDDMEFNDDFMFYEVKGDGNDAIERIVKKLTSDQGSQTDNSDTTDGSTQTDTPDSKDNGTQTDNPDTSDGSTQTNTPDSKDNGTQTDNPDTSDAEKQTNSLPLAEKKLTKTQNNKPNLLQKHKTQYTSSNRGANKLPQAGSKEQSTLGILGVSMLVTGGILRIFKRKKYTN